MKILLFTFFKKLRFWLVIIKFKGILYDGNDYSKVKISFDLRENDTYLETQKLIVSPIYSDIPRYFILALNPEELHPFFEYLLSGTDQR